MIKVLSIDFDYFIAVTSKERDMMFPKDITSRSLEEIEQRWVRQMKLYPDILNIGVTENLDRLSKYLNKNSRKSKAVVSENHSDIEYIVGVIPKIEAIEVVNVDFHHDYYHMDINRGANCSNWLRLLKDTRPNTKISWVRREDSQLESLEGVFPYSNTCNLDNFLKEKYDYIFICFSPGWSPPHLRKEYDNLILQLKGEVEYAE